MEQILLSFTSVIFMFFGPESTPNFDYELQKIVREFRESIMEDSCDVERDIMYLIDNIEEELDNDDKYDSQERHKLKDTLKKAEALEDYVAAIGDCNVRPITIEDFYIANRMVGGSIAEVDSDEYCFDIMVLKIDEYLVHLAWNESPKNYSVELDWTLKKSSPYRRANGRNWFGLPANHLRPLQTNKEDIAWDEKKPSKISCPEW